MIPGGRVNPRQMRQAMKRMGIEQEELEGVEEVIIRTASKEYVIRDPNVTANLTNGLFVGTLESWRLVCSAGAFFVGGVLLLSTLGGYRKTKAARLEQRGNRVK